MVRRESREQEAQVEAGTEHRAEAAPLWQCQLCKDWERTAPVFSVARKQFSANDYLILLMTFVRQALGIALQSTCSLSLWCQQPGASRSASKILFPAKFRLLTLTHTCFFLSLLHTPILPYGPGGKLCFLKAFWF